MLRSQLDADQVKRVMRKILAADRVAALHRLDELGRRGRQVRNHHLPAAPELPHGARKDDAALEHGCAAHVFRALQFGKEFALALEQIPGLAQFPRAQGIVTQHAQAETELAVTAQARPPVCHERRFTLGRVERQQNIHRAVHDRQYSRIVAGGIAVEQLQIFDRGAQRCVVEIMHAQRRIGAHAQRGFGDHAELAVTENHPLEQLGVPGVGAFHDFPGRGDHLQGQCLIGAAAEARRIHVDPAHAQRAADRRSQVERRRQVIQILPAQLLGQAMPENPGFGTHRQRLGIDVQHPAHARHIQQYAAERHRFALGRQAAAANGDRHAVLLRGLEQERDLFGAARDDDAVRQPVRRAAGVSGEGGARRRGFQHLDAARADRAGKLFPVRAAPARGVGLLALDPAQGVGCDRTGAQRAGFD